MSALHCQAKAGSRPSLKAGASRKPVVCRAQQSANQKLASAAAAAVLSLSALGGAPAMASEFDILSAPTPTTDYFIDDASVLSKATRSEINKKLKLLEIQTGYRLEVVTTRKLEFETDAFAFGEKVLGEWYKDAAAAKNKGMLLAVTTTKEGAVVGDKGFVAAVGDDLIDSVAGENITILTEQEKYNAAVLTAVERLDAKLQGNPVPDAPKRNEVIRERNYRTKEETDKSRNVTSTVVGTLLFIACVVPMLQYYGYTNK